jgi:DNA-binding response OmpR family regulator
MGETPATASATTRQRIVLIDDEEVFCMVVRNQLTRSGFDVTVFHTGAEFLQQCGRIDADLVLLDFYLDEETGLDICRRLRMVSSVPVIMLTGLNESSAIVSCLEAGADDYVVKPHQPEQLLARIRALLRRVHAERDAGQPAGAFAFFDISVDVVSRIVRCGAEELQFAEREFALLAALLAEFPQSLDRERCSWTVLRRGWMPGDRAIDVLVSRVREKLRKLGSSVDILTLRGRGYIVRGPSAQQSVV